MAQLHTVNPTSSLWQGNFPEMPGNSVLRKDQLELSLHNEKRLIKEGTIKDDNPLDLSEPFRQLCFACRKGDLKVCQEKITEGVNINARDPYDYTPLILVGQSRTPAEGVSAVH